MGSNLGESKKRKKSQQRSTRKLIKKPSTTVEKTMYRAIQPIYRDWFLQLFSQNGKQKEGYKWFRLMIQYKDSFELASSRPLPKHYNEVQGDVLCEFLGKHYAKEFASMHIKIEDPSTVICITFCYHIWIHTFRFLSNIRFKTVPPSENFEDGGSYFLQVLFTGFQEFKNRILDERSIEELSDNGPPSAAQEGGASAMIMLNLYMFLLLIICIPYAVSPSNNQVFDDAKKLGVIKGAKYVIETGEKSFNDEVALFLTVLDGVSYIPSAIQKSTLDMLHNYYDLGGNVLATKAGTSLRQMFSFVLTIQPHVDKLHSKFFQYSIIQQYHQLDQTIQDKLGGWMIEMLRLSKKPETRKTWGAWAKFGLFTALKQVQKKASPFVLLDSMVHTLDDIKKQLDENKSSLKSGVFLLGMIESFQKGKRFTTNQLKKIVAKLEPKPNTMAQTFDLNLKTAKEETDMFLYGPQNMPTNLEIIKMLW